MENVYVPILSADRMGSYQDGDFSLSAAGGPYLEITFTPQEDADKTVYMVAPGLVFFLRAANSPWSLIDGPASIQLSEDAVAIQVLNVDAMHPLLTDTATRPVTWWIIEGVTEVSFDRFLDELAAIETAYPDVATLEAQRQKQDPALSIIEYRDKILNGEYSVNVASTAIPVVLAELGMATNSQGTFRIHTYYAWRPNPTANPTYEQISSLSALSTLDLLNNLWQAHPLVAAAKGAVAAEPLAIYVRFLYWTPNPATATREDDKGAFVSLPSGTAVQLIRVNHNDAADYTVVRSGQVNADGLVEFNVGGSDPYSVDRDTLNLAAFPDYDLAFLIDTDRAFETQYQRDATPREPDTQVAWGAGGNTRPIWMTVGFKSVDGAQEGWFGDMMDWATTSISLEKSPLEFYVGIPLFLQFEYLKIYSITNRYYSDYDRLPKGMMVEIANGTMALGTFYTDENGQLWGSLFRWDPADREIRILLHYTMEDAAEELPRITGEVQIDTDPAPAGERWRVSNSFDFSQHPAGSTAPFGYHTIDFSQEERSAIGKPKKNGLERMRVGEAKTGKNHDSRLGFFDTSDTRGGADAALVHTFKIVRYAHQLWRDLTGTTVGVRDRWGTIFWSYNYPPGANAILHLIIQIPDTGQPNDPDVARKRPETTLEHDAAGNNYFTMTFPGFDRWDLHQEQATRGAFSSEYVQSKLWESAHVFHEFTHVLFHLTTGLYPRIGQRYADMAAALAGVPSYWDFDRFTAHSHISLAEAISVLTDLIATGTHQGNTIAKLGGVPQIKSSPEPAGADPITGLDDPTLLGTDQNGASYVATGLRVPGALATGLWEYLKLGPFKMKQLRITDSPDLREKNDFLTDPVVRSRFENVVWRPLRALNTPDNNGPDTWHDFHWTDPTTGAWITAAPCSTSYSFAWHIQQDFFPGLSPEDQVRLQETFEAWYLWIQVAP